MLDVGQGALYAAAQRYHALLDSIGQGFCVIEVLFDPDDHPVDFRFTEVNAAFEGLTGLKNAVGCTMRGLMPRHDLSSLAVYGIVRQAGGHVRVRSEVGEGSTFEVLLPRTKDSHADAAAKSGIRKSPLGMETILVVEDESAVRVLVRMVLKKYGYTVLEAADASEAEKRAAAHDGPIHLVLSDVVMPGAGGRAAVEGILGKHPQAKVAFMSGYTDDAVMRQGVKAADSPFLQKPFTPEMLATKVRQVLDAPR